MPLALAERSSTVERARVRPPARQPALISGICRAIVTAAGLAAIVAGPAWAQAPDPAATAPFRKGPLALTPSLTIPGFGYDSNVFNEAVDPKSDFTANVQPQLLGSLRFSRVRVSGSELLNFIYFGSYPTERAVNTNGNIRFELLTARGTAYAGISYVKTNDRPSPEVDTRATHRRRPVTAGMNLRLTGKTSVDVGADYEHVTFDEGTTAAGADLKAELDRTTRVYRGTLTHALTVQTSVVMTVSREESRFQFSPTRNATSIRYLPGVVFAPTALISGRAELGLLRFAPKDPRVRPFTGPVGSADLGYVLFGVTRFGVQFSRDVVPSIDQLQTYFVQTVISGSVTHRISERWDAVVNGNRQRLAYHSLLASPGPDGPGARLDFVNTFGGGIGFYFNRGLRLGTRIERVTRDSASPVNRYDNLRVMGSFTYGFQ